MLNNLAWLYFEKGDARAKELAREAYAVAPEQAEILDTYGWILLEQGGDVAKALDLLAKAHAKYPTNAEIAYHLAQAQVKAGHPAQARSTLQGLLSGNPDFPQREEAEALLRRLKE